MAFLFFDSSALVKRYIRETGSGFVFQTVRPSANNFLFVSRIAGVEVISAIARRRKGNLISPIEAKKAIARFRKHFELRYRKVTPTPDLIASAMEFADQYSLRAYDAVQLASALMVKAEIQNVGSNPLIFVSGDSRLNEAARIENLSVEDPNSHP